jgi:hypothetical protein
MARVRQVGRSHAGAELNIQGQPLSLRQQERTMSSRQLAEGVQTGARLIYGMGFKTEFLQLGPAMQMPAAQPADLTLDQQQWLGEKMQPQRLETMITHET